MPCRRNNHNDKTNAQTVCIYLPKKNKFIQKLFFALQTIKLVINNLNVTKINASTKVVTIYIFCNKKIVKEHKPKLLNETDLNRFKLVELTFSSLEVEPINVIFTHFEIKIKKGIII